MEIGRRGGRPGSGVTCPGLSGGSDIVRLRPGSTARGKLLGGKLF